MVCVVLVPLCLGVKKRAVVLLLTCICLVHVWLGEYWKVIKYFLLISASFICDIVGYATLSYYRLKIAKT